jgi:AcrR family transcriptional regulator
MRVSLSWIFSRHSPSRFGTAIKPKTREAIMAAVARRLENDGLAQLSFTEIAREADVGESTVYRYYPNKEVLLEAFWTGRRKPSSVTATRKIFMNWKTGSAPTSFASTSVSR